MDRPGPLGHPGTRRRGAGAQAREQAGVASALVLAERDGIPRELWDAFARSGSAHLLSISGFHVGVIAALLGGLIALAGRPPRTRAAAMATGVWPTCCSSAPPPRPRAPPG